MRTGRSGFADNSDREPPGGFHGRRHKTPAPFSCARFFPRGKRPRQVFAPTRRNRSGMVWSGTPVAAVWKIFLPSKFSCPQSGGFFDRIKPASATGRKELIVEKTSVPSLGILGRKILLVGRFFGDRPARDCLFGSTSLSPAKTWSAERFPVGGLKNFSAPMFLHKDWWFGPGPDQAGGLGFHAAICPPFLCHGIGLGSWFWPPADSERPQMVGILI